MKDRLGKFLIGLAAIAVGCPIIYFVAILLFTVIKFLAAVIWGIISLPFAIIDCLFQNCGILLPAAVFFIAIYLVLAWLFRANPLKTLFDKDFWKGALIVALFPVTFWFFVATAVAKNKGSK